MKLIHTAFLALAVFVFAGCGARTEALPATQNAPRFESATANDFVKQYSEVANKVAAAYKAKDYTKVTSLSPKLAEVTGKTADAVKELEGADVQKLQEWIGTMTQQLADAASKSVK